MINITSRTVLGGAALAAMLVLAGCKGMPSSMRQFTATNPLAASQEVPANSSAGTGKIETKLDKTTRMLSWTITYSGLTGPVTAGHFHGPAAAGANAGVVVPFTGSMASPITGSKELTEAQIADLVTGKWYANLHTAAHPGGEIRGQINGL